jgi:uncharacterized membrane protein
VERQRRASRRFKAEARCCTVAEFSSYYLVVLLHVTFATLWVGANVFQALVIGPAMKAAGPAGGGFLVALARRGGIGKYMATVATLAVLFGAGAYFQGDYHEHAFELDGGYVWVTLGAILALLAYLHGWSVNFPTERRWMAFLATLKGPPTPEQQQQLQAFGMKLGKNGAVSMMILFVAMLLMLMHQVYV